MYNEKVMEAFKNPQNVGEIENPDGFGKVGNASCGDIMQITLKIENDIIVDAKFKTFGCAAAVATSSTATQMVIGMTVDEAEKLRSDVEKQLAVKGDFSCDKLSELNFRLEALQRSMADISNQQQQLDAMLGSHVLPPYAWAASASRKRFCSASSISAV